MSWSGRNEVHARAPFALRTDPIIDPSLCLLKEGVFSFRFSLKSTDCSIDNKSARRFSFDKLNEASCLPVKSVRILLYFESDDMPAILVRQQRSFLCACILGAFRADQFLE
jgi:hypothetical protein